MNLPNQPHLPCVIELASSLLNAIFLLNTNQEARHPPTSPSVNDRTAGTSKGWCDTLMSSNLGFWLCDRNHISIDQYPGLIGMVQGNADPGFWSCDRSHMIGELAGPDQVHQSNIPVSHPILRLSQLAPKRSGQTVPFLP